MADHLLDAGGLMDWHEFERWMSKIQQKGLCRFLSRLGAYVEHNRLDLSKFSTNLRLTISMMEHDARLETTPGGDQNRFNQHQRLKSLLLIQRAITKTLRSRKKLDTYNTLDDLVELIRTRSNILIITGAGISTSCGIPDFRSSDGLYSQLEKDYGDELEDPHQMFDLWFFRSNPQVFYSFAKRIFPFSSSSSTCTSTSHDGHTPETAVEEKNGWSPTDLGHQQADRAKVGFIEPSPSHRFIKLIESKGKLLRNYTQNIDALEMRAGIERVVQCHGSIASFSCLKCGQNYKSSLELERLISQSKVLLCPICNKGSQKNEQENNKNLPPLAKKPRRNFEEEEEEEDEVRIDWVSKGLVKPDIVFFGEGLPKAFDDAFTLDQSKVDLVLVIGTSLTVCPVSDMIEYIPQDVPQILINRDPIPDLNFDIVCLGNSDLIFKDICERLNSHVSESVADQVDGDRWDLDEMKKFQVDLLDNSSCSSNTHTLHPAKQQAFTRSSDTMGIRSSAVDDDNGENMVKKIERIGDSHVWSFKGSG